FILKKGASAFFTPTPYIIEPFISFTLHLKKHKSPYDMDSCVLDTYFSSSSSSGFTSVDVTSSSCESEAFVSTNSSLSVCSSDSSSFFAAFSFVSSYVSSFTSSSSSSEGVSSIGISPVSNRDLISFAFNVSTSNNFSAINSSCSR